MAATTTQVLAAGDTVTIWPPLSVGMSRDTEPGAQPWKATFVGVTPTGKIRILDDVGKERELDAAALRA